VAGMAVLRVRPPQLNPISRRFFRLVSRLSNGSR
jgi:hypothetical protein